MALHAFMIVTSTTNNAGVPFPGPALDGIRVSLNAIVLKFGREQLPPSARELSLETESNRLIMRFRVNINESLDDIVNHLDNILSGRFEFWELFYHRCTNLERLACDPWELIASEVV